MSLCFKLFQKDAQRLWPYGLVYLALFTIRLLTDPLYTNWPLFASNWIELVRGLTYIALWVLIIELIHQEKLIGDRQYWLTRPFTWKQLVLSKGLFVLVFVLVPLFIGHIAVLLWIGFPIAHALPGLLFKEAIFVALMILPVATLASMTRSFANLILTLIVGWLVFSFVTGFMGIFTMSLYTSIHSDPSWGIFDWIPKSATWLIFMIGALIVLLIQYRNRKPGLSRGLAIVALAAAQIPLLFPPENFAFPIQSHFLNKKGNIPSAQIVLDTKRPEIFPEPIWKNSYPPNSILAVPFRIEGLQSEMRGQIAAAKFTISAGDNTVWHSSWRAFPTPLTDSRNLSFQLQLPVEKEFYEKVKDAPVQISGFLDIILVEHNQVQVRNREYVPGAGVCFTSGILRCLSPWPRAHLVYNVMSNGNVESSACAPWPIAPSLDPVVSLSSLSEFSFKLDSTTSSCTLVRPVGLIRKSFTFDNLIPRNYLLEPK
jgi:hypothetical protein